MTNHELQMRKRINELNAASALYYTKGESPMSDAEWDEKLSELQKLERESGTVLSDSPSARVGSEPLAS
ncbi:MAG: NAD-dependent DNA ligase LigA, partial [Clostridia bacterium]